MILCLLWNFDHGRVGSSHSKACVLVVITFYLRTRNQTPQDSHLTKDVKWTTRLGIKDASLHLNKRRSPIKTVKYTWTTKHWTSHSCLYVQCHDPCKEQNAGVKTTAVKHGDNGEERRGRRKGEREEVLYLQNGKTKHKS